MMSGSFVRFAASGETSLAGGAIVVSEQAARNIVAAHARLAAARNVVGDVAIRFSGG